MKIISTCHLHWLYQTMVTIEKDNGFEVRTFLACKDVVTAAPAVHSSDGRLHTVEEPIAAEERKVVLGAHRKKLRAELRQAKLKLEEGFMYGSLSVAQQQALHAATLRHVETLERLLNSLKLSAHA